MAVSSPIDNTMNKSPLPSPSSEKGPLQDISMLDKGIIEEEGEYLSGHKLVLSLIAVNLASSYLLWIKQSYLLPFLKSPMNSIPFPM